MTSETDPRHHTRKVTGSSPVTPNTYNSELPPRTTRVPPTLRRHATGQWFTKWGGRNRYFGTDAEIARKRYEESLREWRRWLRIQGGISQTLEQLSARYISQRQSEHLSTKHYNNHLRRFIARWGEVGTQEVRIADLFSWRDELCRQLAPKTVAHDIAAVKTLWTWLEDRGLAPHLPLRRLKPPKLPPPHPRPLPLEDFTRIMGAVPPLGSWLRLQYLTACRVSEVVAITSNRGCWECSWLWRHEAKGHLRWVVLSERGMEAFRECRRTWSRQDTYYQAFSRKFPGLGGPKRLRSTAAMHLLQRGISRQVVDLILGHYPSRISRSYIGVDWRELRAALRILRVG